MSFEYGSQFPTNGQGDASTPQLPPGQDAGAPGHNNGSSGQPMQFSPTDGSDPAQSGQPGPSGDQKTTLWYVETLLVPYYNTDRIRMGELEPWIDENFVRNLWFQMGEQVSVKMIRDKFSG